MKFQVSLEVKISRFKTIVLGLGSTGALVGWVTGSFGNGCSWDCVPLKTVQKITAVCLQILLSDIKIDVHYLFSVCLFVGTAWKSWLKTWSSYCLLGWFSYTVCFNKRVGSMKSLDVVLFVSPVKSLCQYALDTHSKNNSFIIETSLVYSMWYFILKKNFLAHDSSTKCLLNVWLSIWKKKVVAATQDQK